MMYVWQKLKDRCKQGSAIIFLSADLDEILQYSDRILVFYSGKVSTPMEASEVNVDQLGQLIGGKGWETIQ
jgi:simple sugar transport system ATP-binding protein